MLCDRVELSAKVLPYVDASGGTLKLTIGDFRATFKNGAAVATLPRGRRRRPVAR